MTNHIKSIRLARGLTLSELARLTSTTPAQIQKLERGERRLTDAWLKRLAVALQCHPVDLFENMAYVVRDGVAPGPYEASPTAARPEMLLVPLYADAARQNPVSMLEKSECVAGGISFDKRLLAEYTPSTFARLALIRLHGDSMSPTLEPGDLLLLDLGQKKATQDGIYALDSQGSIALKRLQLQPYGTRITLLSDNRDYPPYELEDASQLSLIGKVIWVGKRL
jgi:transcriptional regulator with XRE-family HTH domain